MNRGNDSADTDLTPPWRKPSTCKRRSLKLATLKEQLRLVLDDHTELQDEYMQLQAEFSKLRDLHDRNVSAPQEQRQPMGQPAESAALRMSKAYNVQLIRDKTRLATRNKLLETSVQQLSMQLGDALAALSNSTTQHAASTAETVYITALLHASSEAMQPPPSLSPSPFRL